MIPFGILIRIKILNEHTIKSEKIDKTVMNASKKLGAWMNYRLMEIFLGFGVLVIIIFILSIILGWSWLYF